MGNEYFRSTIKQNLKIMSRVFPAGRALRTFEAAARHLNFSRAADELGLTPAAVSYQIRTSRRSSAWRCSRAPAAASG